MDKYAEIQGHLPTVGEFDRLAKPIPVKVGQSLFMRYDMAHSGTDSPGLRLHTVLSNLPILELHNLGETQMLDTDSSKSAGKRRVGSY